MSQTDFPWDIGLYDAHCHPTDTMAAVSSIHTMKAKTLTVMATRGEDQELVQQLAQSLNGSNETLDKILPCFGWHPWFAHQIMDDTQSGSVQKEAHYKAVLTPTPDDSEFIKHLPTPKPLSTLISETRDRLQQFPNALVGEIGLDKSFRLPGIWTPEDLESRDDQLTPGSREGRRLSPYKVKMEHQRIILSAQLRLAGELDRAVSVHSVQAHGLVLETLKELWAGHERKVMSRRERERQQDAEGALSDDEKEKGRRNSKAAAAPFPRRICMHSYSGPVEPIRQFLYRTNPSDVYFSFSAVINFSGPQAKKVCDVIKALPDNRILVESDLHVAGPQMDELLEEVTRRICDLRGWDLRHGVQVLADNWKRFVFG
jgi:Tat protein secretion system quality control protein TatD with DNase activity